MIAAANAGPQPIHNKALNQENLTEAIKYCLTTQTLEAASEISRKMKTEVGIKTAIESFNRNLPDDAMCCDILPDEAAVWFYKQNRMTLKLSDTATFMLIEQQKIKAKYLQRYALSHCFLLKEVILTPSATQLPVEAYSRR
jgi:sterol 3beta-glucosyltransferase